MVVACVDRCRRTWLDVLAYGLVGIYSDRCLSGPEQLNSYVAKSAPAVQVIRVLLGKA